MFSSKSFPSDLSAPASPLELGTVAATALLTTIVWMMIYFLLPLVSSRLRRFTFNLIQKRILNTIKALPLRKKGRNAHFVAEEVIEDIISLDEDLPNTVFAPIVASCRENCDADAIKKNITQYLDNNTDFTNGELKAAPEFIKSLEQDLQNFNLAVQTVACGKKNLAKFELTDVHDFFGEVANTIPDFVGNSELIKPILERRTAVGSNLPNKQLRGAPLNRDCFLTSAMVKLGNV